MLLNDEGNKCAWCCDGGIMEKYHDEEWGAPLHDDIKHFEFLVLESMQCGLSWSIIMKKREVFSVCFEGFDYNKISCYDNKRIREILETPNMIHSERKIRAVINNAQRFKEVIKEFGSFDSYIWSFTGGCTLVYEDHADSFPAENELSRRISSDLKKRGFKFLGPVTVYSYLQSCGIINDHLKGCERYSHIIENYPVKYISSDDR